MQNINQNNYGCQWLTSFFHWSGLWIPIKWKLSWKTSLMECHFDMTISSLSILNRPLLSDHLSTYSLTVCKKKKLKRKQMLSMEQINLFQLGKNVSFYKNSISNLGFVVNIQSNLPYRAPLYNNPLSIKDSLIIPINE